MSTPTTDTVDCAVHNSVAAQQLFRRLFLQGERLQHLLATICNACGPQQSDPITHITHLFLTHPVQCAISAAGLLPFRAHPELLYPFAAMDEPQNAFLRALQTPDNRAHAELRAQMGGGFLVVHFAKCAPLTVSQVDTLTAVCHAALANQQHAPQQRLQAANIVVQRVAAFTNVSNNTLLEVNRNVQAAIAALGDLNTHI